MLALILAIATVVPIPGPTGSLKPTSKISPAPCAPIVMRAKLGGKPVTADNIGALFAQALKDRMGRSTVVTTSAIAQATLDFLSCFQK